MDAAVRRSGSSPAWRVGRLPWASPKIARCLTRINQRKFLGIHRVAGPEALLELTFDGVRIFPQDGFVEAFTIPWQEVDDVYLERLQGDDDDTETFVFKVRDADRYAAAFSAFKKFAAGDALAEHKIHVSYEVVTPGVTDVLRNCEAFKARYAPG